MFSYIMKQCSASKQPGSHNLNIKMYSFKEVLALFSLDYDFSTEELKRAKMMVLKMHPDKSRLPPEYFLFYRDAYSLVYNYYSEKQKTSAQVPHEEVIYEANSVDKTAQNQINKTMKEMGNQQFQQKFNQLFENNMVEKKDTSQYDWFKQNDPLYEFDDVKSAGGLAQSIESVKQKSSALTQYKGVETLTYSSGNNLYDTDTNTYATSDPFSKLKYDDLRKVHKDQTVFAVSESDYSKMKKYSSIDHLQRERGAVSLEPLEKQHAEQMLQQQEKAIQQSILAKKHADDLRTMEYAEKNKSVMSSFFQLTM